MISQERTESRNVSDQFLVNKTSLASLGIIAWDLINNHHCLSLINLHWFCHVLILLSITLLQQLVHKSSSGLSFKRLFYCHQKTAVVVRKKAIHPHLLWIWQAFLPSLLKCLHLMEVSWECTQQMQLQSLSLWELCFLHMSTEICMFTL